MCVCLRAQYHSPTTQHLRRKRSARYQYRWTCLLIRAPENTRSPSKVYDVNHLPTLTGSCEGIEIGAVYLSVCLSVFIDLQRLCICSAIEIGFIIIIIIIIIIINIIIISA